MLNHKKQIDHSGVPSLAYDLIRAFEGCQLKAYVCPRGFKTIGYGHLIKPGEKIPEEIKLQRAEEIFKIDVKQAFYALYRLSPVELEFYQQAALTSFIFNVGRGAYQRSQLRQLVNRGDHENVPHALMKWVWAGGKKLRGLERRRYAEGMIYTGASWGLVPFS